jgi:hypothetical protein
LVRLLVELCQRQFHTPFPVSLVAGYYVARASITFVPVDHDADRVLAYLYRFYRLAHRYADIDYDPARAARGELDYFEVHRRLANAPEADKEALVQSLATLHGELFGLTAEQARESAQYRTEAAAIVDGITGGRSTNLEQDWARIHAALQRCYDSINRQLDARDAAAPSPRSL